MLWDLARGFDHIFCRSVSRSAYIVLNVAAFIDVMDDFADGVLVRNSRMWSVCRSYRFRTMRVC